MTSSRVLLLTTYYHPVLGGVETHARQLAGHLRSRGFDVHVITKRVSRADSSSDIVDGVPVSRLPPIGDRRGGGKWMAVLPFFAKVLAARQRFDVIVCVDYRGIGIAAVVAGRLLRKPVVLQAGTAGVLASASRDGTGSSGVPPESLAVRLIKAPIRVVYRRANHFICIARDIEREALDAGVPPNRVHYLPHGVNLQRFRPAGPGERAAVRSAEGWPADRPVVLFVGRLSTEKGVLDLLEAWRQLGSTDALLVLVGPDMPAHPWDAGPAARAFVTARGLADRVRFYGPSDDTSRLYRAADLFVQPSHFEAFGISVIEALASGVPVVASRVGGMLDFLVDGRNALLHEPRSPESIAAAVGRALGDPGLSGAIAREGLRTVAERFNERVLLDRYADLLSELGRAR